MKLNRVRDIAAKFVLDTLPSDHGMMNMIKAGSKGSNINIAQIAAAVGQQMVNGKRIPCGNNNRTSAHYQQFSPDPVHRGFCYNSYLTGLGPAEFFRHMQGGREGLIDTACKTADTGYLERKLVKLMENFKVMFDETVRDASGNIIQFQYGDDGFDAVNIVRLKIPPVLPFIDRFTLEYEDDMAVIREVDNIERAIQYFEWWKQETSETQVSCPVDVEALFERAKILSEGSRMTLQVNAIWTMCWEFISSVTNELFQNYLILFLQVRRMRELNYTFFKWFLDTLQDKYDRAKVNPGEMVGVLAGQSISEPATQQVKPPLPP